MVGGSAGHALDGLQIATLLGGFPPMACRSTGMMVPKASLPQGASSVTLVRFADLRRHLNLRSGRSNEKRYCKNARCCNQRLTCKGPHRPPNKHIVTDGILNGPPGESCHHGPLVLSLTLSSAVHRSPSHLPLYETLRHNLCLHQSSQTAKVTLRSPQAKPL